MLVLVIPRVRFLGLPFRVALLDGSPFLSAEKAYRSFDHIEPDSIVGFQELQLPRQHASHSVLKISCCICSADSSPEEVLKRLLEYPLSFLA